MSKGGNILKVAVITNGSIHLNHRGISAKGSWTLIGQGDSS